MNEEIFCIDHFFNVTDLSYINQHLNYLGPGNDYVNHEGPFKDQLIANYINLTTDSDLMLWLQAKLAGTIAKPFIINTAIRVKLYLPWDIHSDYYIKHCSEGNLPYYNFLIPLDDFESRTIIFDQYTTNDPNFNEYKKTHQPVENHPDQEFWDNNLSMCWAHDRQYVSIKKILPWQRTGQLVGFPSKYFHSSDNFHTKFNYPKIFLQIRTETNEF